jgi:asparagine synthase (glutamine-hydrolysing)
VCGIAGIAGRRLDYKPDMAILRAMCDSIVHRGPDEEGVGIVDNVALGMRRLSIIDIAGGSQPIYNEHRSMRITFNGELYNFRELRQELANAGHRFATNSDTEVVLHAYEEWGTDCLNRLNGMFAIALHDISRNQLILVRDQLGIKPLFYTITDEAIVWGSEIKAILASGNIERSLNSDALLEFLSWEYVPGEGTLFNNIHKLQPGHMLVATADGKISGPAQYWGIPTAAIETSSDSESQWLDRLDESLGTAVRRQLVSDVPLGAFLSGGVDSSLVVSAMGAAETFSIGFDDPSYNELAYSQEVARHLKTQHTTRIVDSNVVTLFDELMYHMDDPIGDFSIFPTYLVSKLARETVTVSLSGDGGDELFGGYETYVAQERAEKYARVPQALRSLIAALGRALPPTAKKKGLINKIKRFTEGEAYPNSLGHARWRIFLSDVIRESLFTPEFAARFTKPAGHHINQLFAQAGELDGTNRCLYVDARSYLPDNCLVKVDRMSMAVSLEVRVPFLDIDLVELAFSMPNSLKLAGGQTKYLLKKLATKYVPERCVYRPKEGFSIPIKNWLAGQFRPILEKYTDQDLLRSQGIFDPVVVSRLKQEHMSNKANHSHLLWSIIVFQAWHERWLTPGRDGVLKHAAPAAG